MTFLTILGAGLAFFLSGLFEAGLFDPMLKNTAAAMIMATRITPPAAAPMMMPRLELDSAGAGVDGVTGGGGGGGGGGVAAGVVSILWFILLVDINRAVFVDIGLEVDTGAVLLTAELLVGTTATTITVGDETVVVVPTALVLSWVLTALTVMLCCTNVALTELLSMRISVTTLAVPVASKRLLVRLLISTVLVVSTVALITATGEVHAVSYKRFAVMVVGVYAHPLMPARDAMLAMYFRTLNVLAAVRVTAT